MKRDKKYTVSTGNVFADLGLPNPEELLAKAELAFQINSLIKQKKLTKAAAAQLLAMEKTEIADLSYGKLSQFSLEQLLRFLHILGQEITIKITPKKKLKTKPDVSVSFPLIKKIPVQPSSSHMQLHAKKKAKTQ